eukprot:CAMPEP_0204573566 /NCGR_PEP_ID=MMETSP0661-20131031/40100_1 /ASSEMBLY_ACC=CAM_ASM_000606 /TAXON_ID=109239 /ORGANISM="Alexandrium margalefi, Strain AMGDE01CS-322" /LENGTH=439 /DNA_ID=CAMNT_0051582009 /DNA_START=41 /DNA_END=1360 /DNA_ORIENTATION=-
MDSSLTEQARSVSCESRHPQDGPLSRPRSFKWAFLATTICGTVNNLLYCIVSGASQNLVRHFGMESQVTALTMSMTGFALVASFVSTRLLIHLRFYTRICLVLSMSTVAYAGLAVASTMEGVAGFAVAVFFSCFAGSQQVIGEATNIAFLKAFPAELIGGWGAGTGIAGILGSGTYILLSGPLDLSNAMIFGLVAPITLVYWAAFHYLHREATRGLEGERLAKVLGGNSGATRSSACEGVEPGLHEQLQPQDPHVAPANWANVRAAFRCSGSVICNLVAVYMLEYTIYPGLDDRETLCSGKEWYTTMWMCYNVGVTLSRLSVAVFRIERVWLLTLLQAANVAGWVLEVYRGWIRNSLPNGNGLCICAAWMVLVGLCGGATYANCMYQFNQKEGIPNNIRELGMNLGVLMSNLGITTATLSFMLLNRTVLAESVVYPHGC